MISSRDREFTTWGLWQIGSSGVKLQVSNPCSLLRSKSARHERRCEAASEWLVYFITLYKPNFYLVIGLS